MAVIRRKLEKANNSEKQVLAAKVRRMTPGCNDALASLGIE